MKFQPPDPGFHEIMHPYRWGAWWVPLRKMVKDCGKEAVEEKLDAFEADVAEEKATAMAAAMADDSSDEEGG